MDSLSPGFHKSRGLFQVFSLEDDDLWKEKKPLKKDGVGNPTHGDDFFPSSHF